MNNAERVQSAVNFGRLEWTGPNATAGAQALLATGVPELQIGAPGNIAGNYDIGLASFGPGDSGWRHRRRYRLLGRRRGHDLDLRRLLGGDQRRRAGRPRSRSSTAATARSPTRRVPRRMPARSPRSSPTTPATRRSVWVAPVTTSPSRRSASVPASVPGFAPRRAATSPTNSAAPAVIASRSRRSGVTGSTRSRPARSS